ncbi:protealysin inhibitor emfourin [Roseateles sp. BYS78W]|uniref:Protealysin inhibitor emfourin n=1 Tax=Pelomonas candidula TaxID=3299025 RepID=A0ABW7HGT7_9BURK
MQPEDRLDIERLGGFAGMGGPGARIRSTGSLVGHALSADERQHLAALFGGALPAAGHPGAADGFRYRLTLHPAGGGAPSSVELPESAVPERVRDSVHDELI